MTLKRKIYISVSWMLVLICMGIIFWMSARPADQSQAMSDSLLLKIFELIGVNLSSFVIRKAAHMLEFMGLAVLMFNAVYASFKTKLTPAIAFFAAVLYAVTDEVHQLFVEGRACQFRDILIDSTGALIGIAASLVILKIILKIRERRNKNGSIEAVSGNSSEK